MNIKVRRILKWIWYVVVLAPLIIFGAYGMFRSLESSVNNERVLRDYCRTHSNEIDPCRPGYDRDGIPLNQYE